MSTHSYKKWWDRCSVVTVICLALLVQSCTQQSFLQVQLCLKDRDGVTAFIGELRAIAQARHMTFIDGSAQTARELRDVGHPGDERTSGSPVINVGVEAQDGMGLTAGNLGLPGYQVALGFTAGRDRERAQAFATTVLDRLEHRWRVERVPLNRGVQAMGDCG